MTRGEARRQFLNNVPDVLTNLVGAQNSQRGATKIFDTLQNVNLNKQLFYVSNILCFLVILLLFLAISFISIL